MNRPECLTKLAVTDKYPAVYKLQIETCDFNQLLQCYVEEILQNSSHTKTEQSLVNYISRVIEPVGWKAVWRATKESSHLPIECDFIVEVVDVSLLQLEADVVLQSVIVPEVSQVNLDCVWSKFHHMDTKTVPLIELYPICEGDDEESYAKNAISISYVRFFYEHLSRPWDGDDDDFVYSEELLRTRLLLYFDIQRKMLPENMIIKIKSILSESRKAAKDLKKLYIDLHVSDSDSELCDDDILESMALRKKLDEAQQEMEILENPVIRTLVMKKYVPYKSPQKMPHQVGPVTYLVSQQFTLDMINKLEMDPSTVLEFEHSPQSALLSCSSGDRVFIFPGRYRCDNLGWLNGNVEVKGIGPHGSVKLIATGNSEIFLNCHSSSLSFCNLEFYSTQGVISVIVVHHGKVHFKDCVVDSEGAETAITILGGAETIIENTDVSNSQEDGIQLRTTGCLTLKSSKILSCGGHGINIEINEDSQFPEAVTEINLLDSFVISNEGFGLCVVAESNIASSEDFTGDSSLLNMFPWLKCKIENTVLLHNKQNEIGILNKPPFKQYISADNSSSLENPTDQGDTDDTNSSERDTSEPKCPSDELTSCETGPFQVKYPENQPISLCSKSELLDSEANSTSEMTFVQAEHFKALSIEDSDVLE